MAHKPLVRFTFSMLMVLSILFLANCQLAPLKNLITNMKAQSKVNMINSSTYNFDVHSVYRISCCPSGINGVSEKFHS